MRSELSVDELAACSAETAADIRGWQRDGLLADAGLNLRDVERIRLIRALERRGSVLLGGHVTCGVDGLARRAGSFVKRSAQRSEQK